MNQMIRSLAVGWLEVPMSCIVRGLETQSFRRFLFLACLPVLATQVTAQSNDMLLKAEFEAAPHNYSFLAIGKDDQGNPCDGVQEDGTLPNSAAGTIHVAKSDTVRGYLRSDYSSLTYDRAGISFMIDANAMLVRNVTMSSSSGMNAGSPEQGGLARDYSVTFGSIPFTLDSGAIVVPSQALSGKYSWDVSFEGGTVSGCTATGRQSGSGVEVDVIGLRIQTSNLGVGKSVADIHTDALSVSYAGAEIAFKCHSSGFDRSLEIADMTGRTIELLPVATGAESIRLPLSRFTNGLYFARMGDKIAKFVVPASR